MAKLIDLTGKQFNELTVLGKLPPDGSGRTKWNCLCSCGKSVIATGYDLKNGKHKSCGHITSPKYRDLTGMQFGELKVLRYIENGYWECKCSCGNITNVPAYSLTSGHTCTCGHTRRFIDLTGMQFGEWKVLRYIESGYWECECSCGNTSNVHSYALRNGKSLSCGHSRTSKLREDLSGRIFGEWEVLEYIGGRHSKWLCRCSCGCEKEVAAYDLKTGTSRSCEHNRKKPYDDLVGKHFGELTVLKYISKGMYVCQCSCGTIKNILGCNLKSGETIACGCRQVRTKYTKQVIESAISKYIADHGYKPFVSDIADELNITVYYLNSLLNRYEIRHLINTHFGSAMERDIFEYVQEIVGVGNVISRDRKALMNGKELDIYLPDLKLAIEFNGNYWHRESAVGDTYHLEKTRAAYASGIRLIHIFEYEWNNIDTRNKLKTLIKSALVADEIVVQAGECDIRQVSVDEEKYFLDKYHLQGYCESQIVYGLYNDNILISLMSFGELRLNEHYDWELLRYCNKDNVSIIGGAEKLFEQFIRTNTPKSVVSYINISKYIGEVYSKLNFKASETDIIPPNYVWIRGNEVLTRYQTQKHKLLDSGLGIYGDTEDEIMEALGYERIYDCGNIRYVWNS